MEFEALRAWAAAVGGRIDVTISAPAFVIAGG
jgi:hypothetical protein